MANIMNNDSNTIIGFIGSGIIGANVARLATTATFYYGPDARKS